MTPKEHANVLAALNIGRIVAQDDDGNYTREITPKRITEAIAIMRKEPEGWMPIETAPKDGEMILLHCDHGNFKYISCGNWANHRCGYWTTDFSESVTPEELMAMQPTHWMPLPPPPALLEKAR